MATIFVSTITACCGCTPEQHEERTHEVERGSHLCHGCNSIHDLQVSRTVTNPKVRLNPFDVIESARQFARESRDQMLKNPVIKKIPQAEAIALVQQRMELVMDSYLTGFEATLKMLHGQTGKPYEWHDDVDHTELVTKLLREFDLLEWNAPLPPQL